jgi:hypothetical protein
MRVWKDKYGYILSLYKLPPKIQSHCRNSSGLTGSFAHRDVPLLRGPQFHHLARWLQVHHWSGRLNPNPKFEVGRRNRVRLTTVSCHFETSANLLLTRATPRRTICYANQTCSHAQQEPCKSDCRSSFSARGRIRWIYGLRQLARLSCLHEYLLARNRIQHKTLRTIRSLAYLRMGLVHRLRCGKPHRA